MGKPLAQFHEKKMGRPSDLRHPGSKMTWAKKGAGPTARMQGTSPDLVKIEKKMFDCWVHHPGSKISQGESGPGPPASASKGKGPGGEKRLDQIKSLIVGLSHPGSKTSQGGDLPLP